MMDSMHSRIPRITLIGIAICGSVVGCNGEAEVATAPAPDPDTAALAADEAAKIGAATAAVERFFPLVSAGDCDTIITMFAEPMSPEECEEYVREMQGHGMGLVRIEKATVDGRDENAVIVRARLTKQGTEIESLVRVVHREDGWKISF
jgi:hypothetical protein